MKILNILWDEIVVFFQVIKDQMEERRIQEIYNRRGRKRRK